MPFILAFLFLASLLLAQQSVLDDQAKNRTLPVIDGTKQEGQMMRLYHQAAITYKLANSGATGNLTVPLPAFMASENRFAACADAKNVITYTGGTAGALTGAENAGINRELLAETLNAKGIGISNGTIIYSGAASFTPACPVPAGYAVIQTQVFP